MLLKSPARLAVNSDFELIKKLLRLKNSNLLELGCGSAFTTRRIAENLPVANIQALEVDRIQHEKNVAISDLPKVNFQLAGMQDIPADDNSIDVAIMLKSLHHVPLELMQKGFNELHRVLRPGGYLYISEPVFDGEFNEILRLFNDEEIVRQTAFNAIKTNVNNGLFILEKEIHFTSQSRFEGFTDFENRILKASHSDFVLSTDAYQDVKDKFEKHLDKQGFAVFNNPMRVDLLKKPA